jgi:hypothetical protein
MEAKMTWLQPLFVFLVVTSAVACSSLKVGYDYDSTANFNGYHTYDWVADKQEVTGDKRLDNSLLDGRIRTTIGTQLRVKGYTTSLNKQPDFYVAYHLGIKDMMKGSSTQDYIGDYAHGTFTTISDIQPYKEGTLLIDIVDAASQQLVWRGSALTEVDAGMSPEDRNDRINKIVHAMLAHFPPQ